MVIPITDNMLPMVVACINQTLRRFGGCPTYGLTDYVARHIRFDPDSATLHLSVDIDHLAS